MARKSKFLKTCAHCQKSFMAWADNVRFCSYKCGGQFVFWSKIQKTETCWLWTGWIDDEGYGYTTVRETGKKGKRSYRCHCAVYEQHVGPIPEGLVLDHKCRVRNCVNPDHLEPVTNIENLIRGNVPWMVTRRTGLCPSGHDLSIEENVRVRTVMGRSRRECRMCIRAAKKRKAIAAHAACDVGCSTPAANTSPRLPGGSRDQTAQPAPGEP